LLSTSKREKTELAQKPLPALSGNCRAEPVTDIGDGARGGREDARDEGSCEKPPEKFLEAARLFGAEPDALAA